MPQALVGGVYEAGATEIVGKWISEELAACQGTKGKAWDRQNAKGDAMYLWGDGVGEYLVVMLFSLALNREQCSVTSTNSSVDIVQFLSEYVFEDWQAEAGTVEPILQVNTIRYL